MTGNSVVAVIEGFGDLRFHYDGIDTTKIYDVMGFNLKVTDVVPQSQLLSVSVEVTLQILFFHASFSLFFK